MTYLNHLLALVVDANSDSVQVLARELAEVLLRGMCDATYSAIKVNTKPNSVSPTRKLKPKKYAGEGSVVIGL